MGRLFNKLARSILEKFDVTGLSQDLSGGNGAGMVSDEIKTLCRRAAAEGAVLLKNDGVLPLKKEDKVAVFGRCAVDWFYIGYGSGGDVLTPYRVDLVSALRNSGVLLDEELLSVYDKWRHVPSNVPDDGFWGHWPRFYKEMRLSQEVVDKAAKSSDVALVVIGRAAGEDRENTLKKGSYYLNDSEQEMLIAVTSKFKRVALILDIGNVIDLSFIEKYNIGAVLLPWQGGMESGNAVCDVLTGAVNPCGKLTAAIAKSYKDYPSAKDFGGKKYNNYTEDIYVGYRYFETFNRDAVVYPFGFGLSYTNFKTETSAAYMRGEDLLISVTITNTGALAGKTVPQLYISAPQGALGKPNRQLVAFKKTKLLAPNESETIDFSISRYDVASYDDSGKSGNRYAYVLEKGMYSLYVGENVRDAKLAFSYELAATDVIKRQEQTMAPVGDEPLLRLVNRFGTPDYEYAPIEQRGIKNKIITSLPKSMLIRDGKYTLSDVAAGKTTLDAFVAQLSVEELEALTRGDGTMNSALGATGNAGVFGGITEGLREKRGIPPVTTTDGPSGIRLKTACSLLPSGTLIASTWDEELVTALYFEVGNEMLSRGTDVLLAPGMNIQRNPLCGRNFEYFSEDPLLSGRIAAAVVLGIQHDGLSACPKHFACNNQETKRNTNDSRLSERALREIYLKGFEIVVKNAKPLNIMTSYNKINNVWSHYNYALCESILRGEWGYEGNVITDWWMRYADSPEFPLIRDNAYRVRARVDVLMPGSKSPISGDKGSDGTLLESYGKQDGITAGEMQLIAKDVLSFILKSSAMKKTK